MKEAEMELVASWIDAALRNGNDYDTIAEIRKEVHNLTNRFPIPE